MPAMQFSLRALLSAATYASIAAAMIAQAGAYGAATACTVCMCGAILSLFTRATLSYRRVFGIGLSGTLILAAIVFAAQFYETSAALISLVKTYELVNDWSESQEVFLLVGCARAAVFFSVAFAIVCFISTGADQNGWRRLGAITLATIIVARIIQQSFASAHRIGDPAFWSGFWQINSLDGGIRVADMHVAIVAIQALCGALYLRSLLRRHPLEATAFATMLMLFNDWAAVVWLDPMNDYM
jgi:hypothetical protein